MSQDKQITKVTAFYMAVPKGKRKEVRQSHSIAQLDGHEILCADCAAKESEETKEKLIQDVNYESELYCEECSKQIETAYGVAE